MRRDGSTRAAAWVAVALAVAGAVLLYPIGSLPLDCAFALVKACMVAGLVVFALSARDATAQAGFTLWAVASVGAIVLTICKWNLDLAATPWDAVLYVGSMAVDLGMPALVYSLSRRAG